MTSITGEDEPIDEEPTLEYNLFSIRDSDVAPLRVVLMVKNSQWNSILGRQDPLLVGKHSNN